MLFTRKKSNQLSPIQAADGARGEELVPVECSPLGDGTRAGQR